MMSPHPTMSDSGGFSPREGDEIDILRSYSGPRNEPEQLSCLSNEQGMAGQPAPPINVNPPGTSGITEGEAMVNHEPTTTQEAAPQPGRVRFGESEQPHVARIQLRSGGAPPKVTISRAPTLNQRSNAMYPHEPTGIKRPNHPGQIDLSGLTPQASQGSADDMRNVSQTNTVDAQGEDHNKYMAFSNELDALEDASEPVDHVDTSQAALLRKTDPSIDENFEGRERGWHNYRSGYESGTTTPAATSESSWDPREELEQVDIIEGETDGMPSKPSRTERHKIREEQQKTPWQKMRGMLGLEKDNNEEDLTEKGLFSEGATNTKSVPVQTSLGLRHGRHRPSKIEREAAKLVKAHRLFRGDDVSDASGDEITPPGINREHLPDSGASTPDPLTTQQRLDARPAASTGVLGQLMKLYEQQKADQDMSESEVGPGAPSESEIGATPVGGGLSVVGNQVTDSYGNSVHVDDIPPEILHQANQTRDSQDSAGRNSRTSAAMSRARLNNNLVNVGRASHNAVKGVATEAGLDVMDERPKAARSAAGVIGALIATSGNLIGAVSPQHAQLGPNPNRPGYTLDRYLLPDVSSEKIQRQTAKIVRDAAPVPKGYRGPLTPGGGPMTPEITSQSSDPNFNPYFAHESRPETGLISSLARPSGTKAAVKGFANKGVALGQSGMSKLHLTKGLPSTSDRGVDYFGKSEKELEQIAKSEWQRKVRKRKQKSKKQEIFITMHVAAILKRQEFLMKLARALMMFGGPTHRFEVQIQQTANVLDINCRCIHLPGLMIMSFGDDTTHTSETKIIKQGSAIDLTKLTDMHTIYWNVIHDKIGVEQGSKQLDALIRRKPYLSRWLQVLVGGLASAFITVGSWGFQGSFIDALAAFCLGAFMIFCQTCIKSEIYSNVFEIVFATVNSFIAMALHQARHPGYPRGTIFCYKPVVSGSIVLILPGFIVLSAALELQSKSMVSGSVRLVYAIIYSVLLGLGLSIGALPLTAHNSSAGHNQNLDCRLLAYSGNEVVYDARHWYNKVPGREHVRNQNDILKSSMAWAFLTVPGYAMLLALRSQAKITRKEFPAMVFIACCGWVVSNWSTFVTDPDAVPPALTTHTYLYSTMGSFTVGILANIYGRIFDGRSFVVAVPGILFQLPSGLSGGASFLTQVTNSVASNFSQSTPESTVGSGLQVGEQLLNVSLGIAIGLFASTILMHILGGSKIRGSNMFSF